MREAFDPRRTVVELCRQMYGLGWASGTGGGLSLRHEGRVYLAPSGVQKERLQAEDLIGGRLLALFLVLVPFHVKAEGIPRLNLDHVVLRLGVEQSVANTGSAETQAGDASYRSVLERVSQGRSICDDRLPKSVLTLLFGEHAESIRSCALIPVVAGGDGVCGVLALGALEAERFRPNMGTVYLDRLGELVGTTVERLRGAGG